MHDPCSFHFGVPQRAQEHEKRAKVEYLRYLDRSEGIASLHEHCHYRHERAAKKHHQETFQRVGLLLVFFLSNFVFFVQI